MKQVWITKIGGPEVLVVKEAADPEPGAGEVRIAVKAAGVNFADNAARQGLYPDAPKLPAVVGYEVSGVVDKVGTGVTTHKVGDRVAGLTRFGGYSSSVVVPSTQAAHLPDNISFEVAAAIPVTYLTAWLMLVHQGNVRKGDTVLVHAAAGGVGQSALQICQWRGAEVIGTASASKHERLRAAGVKHCIDYNTQDFEEEVHRITNGRGVDIVLDAVGGKSFEKSYNSLAPLGKLFVFGGSAFTSGETRNLLTIVKAFTGLPKFKPMKLMSENRGVFGINIGHLWDEAPKITAMLAEIMPLVADGTFKPVIDKTFTFEQAGEAHAMLAARKNFGKVLLTPS